jgi:hypothetical protein
MEQIAAAGQRGGKTAGIVEVEIHDLRAEPGEIGAVGAGPGGEAQAPARRLGRARHRRADKTGRPGNQDEIVLRQLSPSRF